MKPHQPRRRSDVAGIACSAGCAAHCAAVPVLASIAPTMGFGWLAGSVVHQLVAVICCVLVARAILPAWRQHRDHLVAVFASLGLSLILLA
ncbi:MAG: MerC domain-containing protein, partial [Rubripirellula sp.]